MIVGKKRKRSRHWRMERCQAGARQKPMMRDLHIGNETTTDNQDGLLSDKTLSIHEVDDLVEGVHVLVDFTSLDDLPSNRDRVVRKVLVDGLLVDARNVWRQIGVR